MQSKREVLDVGCGEQCRGTVNLDVQIPHCDITHVRFVKADVNLGLPFKNKQFHTTYAFHIIEHVDNPFFFLKELIRVTQFKVILRTPHRFSRYAKKDKTHKWFFTKRWFEIVLKKLGVRSFSAAMRLDPERDISYFPPLEIIIFIYP